MKQIIITAICFIATLTFTAKVQSQTVIDNFPYTTGTITSSEQLINDGWGIKTYSLNTTYGLGLYTGSQITSPELKGFFMTVSAIISRAANNTALNLYYSYDGITFNKMSSYFFQNTDVNMVTNQNASCQLPFGVKYFKIENLSNEVYIKSITITNEASINISDTYKNLTWTLSGTAGNIELNISGTGVIPDFKTLTTAALQDSIPWYKYKEGITKLTIGSGITSIGNNAFREMLNLKDIALPASITRIGDFAFYDCAGPTSLYIPNATTSIGESAFAGMTNLDYVSFGTGLKTVGRAAFASCIKLTSVKFSASNCRIFGDGDNPVFASNIYLNTFLFSNNVKTIPDYMFATLSDFRLFRQDGQGVAGYINSDYIEIPPSIKVIGKGAFMGTSPSYIYIPSSVDTIYAEAFRDNDYLDELHCERATPPVLGGGLVFHNIDKGNCLLVVPAASYNAYAGAAQWKDFMFIVDASYTNAALRSLAVNGSAVEDFDGGVYTYSLNVPFEVASITLNAEAAASGSTVEGVGTFDLNVGLNVFIITVTAADGVSTMTYSIGVTRDNMPVGVEGLAAASSDGGLRFNNPVTDGQLRLFGFDPASAVEIYDLNGRKMYESRSGSDVISVAGFARGVYVVKNGGQTAKLVKQ
jgi:hypothetical protein